MDQSVVQEIANQLGMAVDQVGTFVQDNLPAYAQMKIMEKSLMLAMPALALVIALAVFAIALHVAKGMRDSENKDANRQWTYHLNDYRSFEVSMIALIVAGIFLLIEIVAIIAVVPQIYGWQNCPEAMLMNMVLQKM